MPISVHVPDELRAEIFPPREAALPPPIVEPPKRQPIPANDSRDRAIQARLREKQKAEVIALRQRRQRMKEAETMEPESWQEKHAPTEPVQVRISQERTAIKCRRRKPDARIWNEMTADQEWAAALVMEGWRIVGGSYGCRTMAYDRRSPGHEPNIIPKEVIDRESKVAKLFQEWVRSGRTRRDRDGNPAPIRAMTVIDYIAGGYTLAELDKQLGARREAARTMIFASLDYMLELAPKMLR